MHMMYVGMAMGTIYSKPDGIFLYQGTGVVHKLSPWGSFKSVHSPRREERGGESSGSPHTCAPQIPAVYSAYPTNFANL
jgi:hypothetical protein